MDLAEVEQDIKDALAIKDFEPKAVHARLESILLRIQHARKQEEQN